MAQFVPLEMDTGAADWQTWARRYRHEGAGIPIVFVVRADGEMLYGKSGALSGDALPQLLKGIRPQAGAALNVKQFEQLTRAVERTNQYLAAGEIDKAAATIAPVADSGSFAQAAVEASKLAEKLVEQAKAGLAEAEQKLGSENNALLGAVQLTEIGRVYRTLPAVRMTVAELTKKVSKDAEKRTALAHAALIDKAQVLAQQKLARRALEQYQQIVSRYPSTPVAELAQARIKELEASSGEAGASPSVASSRSASDPKPAPGGAATDKDLKAASSNLRLAKTFAKGQPEKARGYAEKVIELAPGSELAKEAELLLAELPPAK